MLDPALSAPAPLGYFRNRVVFATVTDVIDPTTRRSVKQYQYTGPEYACIRPVGTMVFIGNFDSEKEVTHTIFTRYRFDAHTYDYIIQKIMEPGLQTYTEFQYEIVRAADWNGVPIWSRFDAKLLSKLPTDA